MSCDLVPIEFLTKNICLFLAFNFGTTNSASGLNNACLWSEAKGYRCLRYIQKKCHLAWCISFGY